MKIMALAGGVGGAKLADGLSRSLPSSDLSIIVNTGDDFEHLGLHISPDLDTVCYTLSGLANPETGWGRAGESWEVIAGVEFLGGPAWFRLGDKDLATHLERTRRLRAGEALSAITADFCRAWGVGPAVYPMTDSPAETIVHTEEGALAFQDYFVRRRCEPKVVSFAFPGGLAPAAGLTSALAEADAFIICPSNPWVSVDPILNVSGVRDCLAERPVWAVSPIIGGQAVKGPAAKMYAELGIVPSPLAVAQHYIQFLDGIVIDTVDRELAGQIEAAGLRVHVTNTWMKTSEDRIRLAEEVLNILEGELEK